MDKAGLAWVRAYAAGRRALDDAGLDSAGAESARFHADRDAAWRRWHDRACRSLFDSGQWPWFLALERARVEALASAHLPGVAANLRLSAAPVGIETSEVERLYRIARHCFADAPCGARQALIEDEFTARESGWWARLAGRLGRARGRPRLFGHEPLPRLVADLEACRGELADAAGFVLRVRPLIERLAAAQSSPAADTRPDADQEANPEDITEDDVLIEAQGGEEDPAPISQVFPDYRVFTTALDELGPASRWYRPDDAERLEALNRLDRHQARRLAHRLQRRLQAARLRRWSFDLEEGLLDSRKLARLVGERPNTKVFRQERRPPVPDACVGLLVDQSGSMRGNAHLLAAQAIDLAIHTLEVCGIAAEVLGFTTCFGAENELVDRWRRSGGLARPGRLNALRHIVLKSSNQPWRVARRYLGLLLRPDFGRENVDGESLYWAARRLLGRPEPRKLLLVLSDGTPYDEATVTANSPGFLEGHLHQVVGWIERSPIELLGVGTGRDVGRYYPRAVMVRRPEQIARVLFDALAELLTPHSSSRMRTQSMKRSPRNPAPAAPR